MKPTFILALACLSLCSCTNITMPNGARLSTPAEMKNVTMTATTFHADEISHRGVYQIFQQVGAMLGVGAFLP